MARYLFQLTSVTPAGSYVRLDSASGSTSPTAVSPTDSAYVFPGAILHSDASTGALPTVAAGVATLYQKTLDASGGVTATATLTGTLVEGSSPGTLPAQTWPIPVNTDPAGLSASASSIASNSAFTGVFVKRAAGISTTAAPLPFVNVRDYGAVGDGTSRPLSGIYATLAAAQAVYPEAAALTDELDWCAIQRCLAANGRAELPAGTFVVNRTVDATGSAISLKGAGQNKTTIQQATANIPIVRVGSGGGLRFADMTLTYASQRPATETTANCISIINLGNVSSFQNVKCQNGARGWYNETPGYVFSTSWRDCQVTGWSISAVDISNSGGITGNVIHNLYCNNNASGSNATTAAAAVILAGWDDGAINQINIEHLNAPYAFQVNNCRNLSVEGMHVEDFTQTANFNGVIDVISSNTTLTLQGVSIIFSTFDNAVASTTGLIRIADGVRLTVRHLQERNNTITSGTAAIIYSGSSTGSRVYLENIKQSGTWQTFVLPASSIPQVQRYNEQRFHWQVGTSAHWFNSTAAPTTGTWAVGDTVVNTAPSEQGTAGSKYVIEGWTCVGAGTPGTWVPKRCLTGN